MFVGKLKKKKKQYFLALVCDLDVVPIHTHIYKIYNVYIYILCRYTRTRNALNED